MDSEIPAEVVEAVARAICIADGECKNCERVCSKIVLTYATAALSSPAVRTMIQDAERAERERVVAIVGEEVGNFTLCHRVISRVRRAPNTTPGDGDAENK